jgi:hypothetical protein
VSVGGDGGGSGGGAFDWLGNGESGMVVPSVSPSIGAPVLDAPSLASPTIPTPIVATRRERPRARTGVLGWIAFVFAIVAPPLGFVLSVIARALSLRKYRRTTRVLSAALTLSIVLSVVLAAGGAVAYAFAQANTDQAKLVAAAQPFCVSLNKTPGVLDKPAYGWPTDIKALPETIADMRAYEARWEKLAKIAPQPIKPEVASVGAAAKTIVGEVVASNTISRESNLSRMSTVTSATTIPAYVAKYCG